MEELSLSRQSPRCSSHSESTAAPQSSQRQCEGSQVTAGKKTEKEISGVFLKAGTSKSNLMLYFAAFLLARKLFRLLNLNK